MIKVKNTILDSNFSYEEKISKIYNYMKHSWWSWNSSDIQEKIGNRLLNEEEFIDEKNILKNENTINYIENNNKKELEKLLGKELTKKILEKYTKIRRRQEKNRDLYAKQLKEINKERRENWESEIKIKWLYYI